jgi:hypothetical protein
MNGSTKYAKSAPLTKLEVMEREMERAIAGERYERAAELR